jgi:midasin
VAQGRWVVIEGIDLAPGEVLAALAPLLERRVLHVAARAESVQAAAGFQVFATVTCSAAGERGGRAPAGP